MGAAGAAVGLGLQAVGTAGALFGGRGGNQYASGITQREVELITHKWEKYDKRLLENEAKIRQAMLEQSLGPGGFAEAIFAKEEAQLKAIRDAALSDLEYQIAQSEDQLQKRILEYANQQQIQVATAQFSANDLNTQMDLTEQRRDILRNQVDLLMGDIDRQGLLDDFAVRRRAGEVELALNKQDFQQEYEVGDVRRRVQDVAFSGEFNRSRADADVVAAQQGREFSTSYAAGSAAIAIDSAKATKDMGIAQAERNRTNRLNQVIDQWASTEEEAAQIRMALGVNNASTDRTIKRMLDRVSTVTNRTVEDVGLQSALAEASGELGVAQAGARAADIRGQADLQSLNDLFGAQRGQVGARADERIGNIKAQRQLTEAQGLLAMGRDEREGLRSLNTLEERIGLGANALGRQSARDRALLDQRSQEAGLDAQMAMQQNAMDRLRFGLSPQANYMADAQMRDLMESREMTGIYGDYIRDEVGRNYERNLAASQTTRDANRQSFDARSQLAHMNAQAEMRQAETQLASQLLQGQLAGGSGQSASLSQIASALGGLTKGALSLFNQPTANYSQSSSMSPILSGYSSLLPGFSGASAQLPSFQQGPRFSGASANLPAFRQAPVTNPSLFTNSGNYAIDNSVQFQGFGNF